MSNCHVKGNLAADSVKLNNRQHLNMVMAFVTYVLCLEVQQKKRVVPGCKFMGSFVKENQKGLPVFSEFRYVLQG